MKKRTSEGLRGIPAFTNKPTAASWADLSLTWKWCQRVCMSFTPHHQTTVTPFLFIVEGESRPWSRFILLQKLDKYSRKLTRNIMHVYPRSEVLGVFCYTYGDRFILRVKKSCGVANPPPISLYFQHVSHEPHSYANVCWSCGMTLWCLLSVQIGLPTYFVLYLQVGCMGRRPSQIMRLLWNIKFI